MHKLDRNQIIELLEVKIRYKGLKLPSYIDFHVDNKVLSIVLSSHNSVNEEVFSCAANMQSDESAFEAWSICLKHHLPKYFDRMVLNWKKPIQFNPIKQLHYNRFLYRAIRFRQMFNWFEVADINKNELVDFESDFKELEINTPLKEASITSEESSKEKQIEYNQKNLDCIKDKFHLQSINHQLPVGVQKNGESFFTGRASAIDIWGLENNNLNIFELKYNNKKTGIISELLFYSEVMYDLFVSKKIEKPSQFKKIRNAEYLYGNSSLEIEGIKSYLLFDKLHPLVVGTTALINTNNFGIKFFNVQYKLKKDTFLIDSLHYKGAFQMEDEISQTSFRNSSCLAGHGYLLNNGDDNLHESIREDVKRYFSDNNIDWWTFDNSKTKPTRHMVSSQIQCLNYLFALRKDKDGVLKLAQLFNPDIDDVFPTIADKDTGYIAFEFVYENAKLLNESDTGAKRGSYCTSVDAFIIAKRHKQKVLIPIEWKYSENYFDGKNKALESEKGRTRQNRYNHLIEYSKQLKSSHDLASSVYYYEPFYEFMRQTLLVEQMIVSGIADDFIHIVVIPSENKDLLDYNYEFSKKGLLTTWRNCLSDQTKFRIIDQKQILQILDENPTYSKLAEYLKLRY
jgi:hypothetical protein